MATQPSTNGTDLTTKIVNQVEYYFGDQNLARDKFLLQKINEDDGWVTLDCLLTFNRLKQLTVDHKVITDALRQEGSGLIEIHEDNTKLRRKKDMPIPDPNDPIAKKISQDKTVYAKGFPVDATLDQLETFVHKFGKTVFIKMRRDDERKFKGSVFFEFKDIEDAQKFCDAEEIKYGETPLVRMSRNAYYKMKGEEARKQRGSDHGKKEQPNAEEQEESFESGCILHFEGCGEGVSREDLKGLFGKEEEIQWVDFNRNDQEGFLRFKSEGGAQRAIDAVKALNDGKVVLNDATLEVRVLEGEEESQYWKKVRQLAKSARDRKRGNRGNDRGRGRKSRFPRRHERKVKQEDDSKNSHITFDSDDEAKGDEGKLAVKRAADDSGDSPKEKQAKVEE